MATLGSGIAILGMHRSGTSLVAALLAELGCRLGSDLVPADEHNLRGYWEHRGVVEAHDAFLHAIGRTWSDPRPIPPDRFLGTAASRARDRLAIMLRDDLFPHALWALKDPRLCRLLPLSLGVVDEAGCSLTFLHVVRSPEAVARSLAARDGMSVTKSAALWLRHNLEAERSTRGRRRYWLVLERLIDRAPDELRALAAALPLPAMPSDERLEAAWSACLDPALLHHRPTGSAAPGELHPWVTAAHQSLLALADGDGDPAEAALDRLHCDLGRAEALVYDDEWGWEEGVRQERELRLRREVEGQTRQIEALRAEQLLLREPPGTKDLAGTLAEILEALGRIQPADLRLPARFDDIRDRLERLHRMVGEDVLGRQVALLERSLAVSAGLESEWGRFRERALAAESAEAAAAEERRHAVAERDDARARAALTDGEREAAIRSRDSALGALDGARRELSQAQTQLQATRVRADLAVAERDRLGQELDRISQVLLALTSSHSWRATMPLRAVGRALRSAARWVTG